MRVPRDVWAAVSAYAKQQESNNTAVVVAALRGFLDGAGRGVPELEGAVESCRVPGPVSKEPSLSPAASPSPRVPGDPRLSQPTRDQFNTAAGLARAQARWETNGEW